MVSDVVFQVFLLFLSQMLQTTAFEKKIELFLFSFRITMLHVHIKMRRVARPTAETDTRVPMQCFITSYFAASSWALNAWISWKLQGWIQKQNAINQNNNSKQLCTINKLTRSSLFVRLQFSAFWFANSSCILLDLS